MRQRIRAWLLRVLNGVAVEDVPEPIDLPTLETGELWGDMWALRDYKMFWPSVTRSDVWKNELEPFFKQALLATSARLMAEKEIDEMRMLQARMQLLNEWLEAPIRAEIMVQAALTNAYKGGRPSDMDRIMNRGQKINA